MLDLGLDTRSEARLSHLAVDNGDQDGAPFEGVGEGAIKAFRGTAIVWRFDPPFCNILECRPDCRELDGRELDVEGNRLVAFADVVEVFGELGGSRDDGQYTADATNDLGHPISVV